MTFKCQFCKEADVPEDNMICESCAEKEIELQALDEKMADYDNEQHRLRYQHIHTFDNELGKISVVYGRRLLCTWNYNVLGYLDENSRKKAMIEAKGYTEGWLDAVVAAERALKRP